MKLTLEDIQKITLGALRIYEKDGYVNFSRFDVDHEKELVDYGCGGKVYGMANIKLEFYTKGGEISFDYKVSPGTVREYYSIDILLDGVYKYNVAKNANVDEGVFKYTVPQTDNEQRVTLYFPTTACVVIKNLSLPEDYVPHKRTLKILTYGDSLVQGYHPNHFQNTFMNIVSDYFDADMVNQAIGGDCFRDINVKPVGFTPAYITVSYGINDWCSGRLGKGEDADGFLKKIAEVFPGVRVIMTLPGDNNYIESLKQNDDLIKTNKLQDDVAPKTYEGVRSLLAEVAKKYPDVVLINAKNFVPQYDDCYVYDKVHFTDLGNVLYANGYIKQAKEIIK